MIDPCATNVHAYALTTDAGLWNFMGTNVCAMLGLGQNTHGQPGQNPAWAMGAFLGARFAPPLNGSIEDYEKIYDSKIR